MKTLIAIISCHNYHARRKAIRDTWLGELQSLNNYPYEARLEKPADVQYKFFVGRHSMPTAPTLQSDEVALDVDDGYRGLPAKTQAICRWALENGYEALFKCDDDVYLQPTRLVERGPQGDYSGRKRGPSGGKPAPYASGFSYWLSARAMKVLAQASLTDDPAEDRWTGNTLLTAGIPCVADYSYVVVSSGKNALSHVEGPRQGNTLISACEYSPEGLVKAHQEWLTLKSGHLPPLDTSAAFGDVCVMVKTFLRNGYLFKTVEGIQKTMPGAKIVIVDDGHETSFKISWYAKLRRMGHACAWLPFDSGFGAKANEAIKHCDRPFVLIASDDFNFEDPAAAQGVLKLQTVLRNDPTMHVASGRVNNNPYEARLAEASGIVTETAGYGGKKEVEGIEYHATDLTVNYSLIKREVFNEIGWDEDVKIGGGEHGAFYLDLKRGHYGVCWVPGVNVNELRGTTDWLDPQYAQYRGRARQPGRLCLSRRGVRQYRLMGGGIEEC